MTSNWFSSVLTKSIFLKLFPVPGIPGRYDAALRRNDLYFAIVSTVTGPLPDTPTPGTGHQPRDRPPNQPRDRPQPGGISP
jgi:hypothetical protein